MQPMAGKTRLPDEFRTVLERFNIIEPPAVPPIEKLQDAITKRNGAHRLATNLEKITHAAVGLPGGEEGLIWREAIRADAGLALCEAFCEALKAQPQQATLTTDQQSFDDAAGVVVEYGKDEDAGNQPIDVEIRALAETANGGTNGEAPRNVPFEPTTEDAEAWLAGPIPAGVSYQPAYTARDGAGNVLDLPGVWFILEGWTYDGSSGDITDAAGELRNPPGWETAARERAEELAEGEEWTLEGAEARDAAIAAAVAEAHADTVRRLYGTRVHAGTGQEVCVRCGADVREHAADYCAGGVMQAAPASADDGAGDGEEKPAEEGTDAGEDVSPRGDDPTASEDTGPDVAALIDRANAAGYHLELAGNGDILDTESKVPVSVDWLVRNIGALPAEGAAEAAPVIKKAPRKRRDKATAS